jgi:hypothetical protein
MELWNEYEGSTIAGTFRLERLLRPEGRSAFFSTTSADGRSTVLRLIESHYDDDEILARWNTVASLKHDCLLGLTKFGHVVMDDTSLVYVVMEPTDADLGQVLRERALTLTETRQLAESLVPALAALHSIGLVHEHIQPINVLAVGETVKLRSDCIREAQEGAEGDAARNRDVYDLSLLLLQALTLERNPDRVLKPTAQTSPLPAPFREIVSNGLSGRWTLAQIAKALANSTPAVPSASYASPSPKTPTPPSAAQPAQSAARTAEASQTATATAPASTRTSSQPSLARSANGAAANAPTGRGLSAAAEASAITYRSVPDRARVDRGTAEPSRTTARPSDLEDRQASPLLRAALIAAALLGLILLLWHLTHRHPTAHAAVPAPARPMQTLASMPKTSAATPALLSRPQPARPQPVSEQPRSATANWRVIAFTYNQSSQAQTKADRLTQRNPSLHFEVFSPHGRPPYLVAVNGFMTREGAFALRDKLRGKGLPHDIYAQNYGSRSR